MSELVPLELFKRISEDIPSELHKHLFVIGSLAAAFHFEGQLERRAVNTKDADIIVHPAGDVASSRSMASRLLEIGWKRHPECYPRDESEPRNSLRAIRLYPPGTRDYFVELLSLPEIDQQDAKTWLPVRLDDGWYGLPCFRFQRLTAVHRISTPLGIEYAAPEMMALANLLSHRELSDARMESDGPMKGRFRCSKDLGRVIAIAILAGRETTERWSERWLKGLEECFPTQSKSLAATCGDGIVKLLSDGTKFQCAWQTASTGLLSGRSMDIDMFRASADRLIADAIRPLAKAAHG